MHNRILSALKKYALTCFLMLFVGSTLATAGDIRGLVLDAETSDPLPGANVLLQGTTYGTATDADGRFAFAGVPAGDYTLIVRFIGYESHEQAVSVDARGTLNLTVDLAPVIFSNDEIAIVADRARDRETPVAFTNVKKAQIQRTLGSRDVPMVLNTTPGVYATESGGGAGDARINVRGFNQRNVAVMINGVPVNDMENGWVYWSNWDGLGDATSSIQVQRGIGASNLAVPSIGGTMNILTDAAALRQGAYLKQEVGSGGFLKSSLTVNTGLLGDKFAASFVGVRKTGDGVADHTWTDAWSYFGALSYQVNATNRLQAFVVGAPQQHGQRRSQMNIANWDRDFAQELGIDLDDASNYARFFPAQTFGPLYNSDWGRIDATEGLEEYYNGDVHQAREPGILSERVNYYHKPQANVNWYWYPSDRLFVTNVFYASVGRGGGSGPYGAFYSRLDDGTINWQKVYEKNTTNVDPTYDPTETRATTILRNSVNSHNWYGWVGTVNYRLTDNVKVTTGLDARYYRGEHYREVRNLIGGDYYVDFSNKNQASPIKRLGDKVAYHNDGLVRWYGGFGQVEGTFGDLTGTLSGSLSNTDFKRVDYFIETPGGGPAETDWQRFIGYKVAGGLNYNLTEAVNVYGNAGFISKPPSFDGVFYFDNSVYEPAFNEKITSYELGAGYRSGILAANLNLYNTRWADRSWQGRIRTDAEDYFFLLRGVDALHQGVELDVRLKPSRIVEFNGVVSLGDWRWLNDVETTIAPEDNPSAAESFKVYAKDLKVGDAAQTQFVLGASLFPVKGAFLDVTAKHFRDYYAEFDPTDRDDPADRAQPWKAPAYTLVDLHAGYDLPFSLPGDAKLRANLNVFNLLDATYVSDATDGSSHEAGAARVYLGLPRRVNLGVQLTF